MNLDRLTIEIRPRQAWEAVDLGVLMARRWWWPLTRAWLLVSGPVWLVLSLLPPHLIALQVIIVWWLKPLFERPLLHILSQAIFDAEPTTRETLKAFPRVAAMQVFSSLLWRRFSPTRSMDLPVVQLEGLGGSRRADRLRILHREDSNPAFWITILGMHMEMFIVIAVYVLVVMFWPQVIDMNWNAYFIEQKYHWFNLLQNLVTFGAMTLVAPFYVTSGFAIYLNRRIRLEAWDLEIAFKRIVQRRQNPPRMTTTAVALLLAVLVPTVFAPQSQAQDTYTTETDPIELSAGTSRELIGEVKAGEVFHQKKTIKVPDLSWLESDENEKQSKMDLQFLKDLVSFIARFGEAILWVALILFVFFVVYRYRNWLAGVVFDKPVIRTRQTPKTLFGLDLSAESLPENIGDSATTLWNQKQYRDCLSLLYRASLSRLIASGLDIRDGDTELECLESTKKFGDRLSAGSVEYFSALTHLWRQLAYGHIPPREDEAIHLCSSWNRVWQTERNDDHQSR